MLLFIVRNKQPLIHHSYIFYKKYAKKLILRKLFMYRRFIYETKEIIEIQLRRKKKGERVRGRGRWDGKEDSHAVLILYS